MTRQRPGARAIARYPLRAVVGYEVTDDDQLRDRLECGHVQRRRRDSLGETNAERRRCRACPPREEERREAQDKERAVSETTTDTDWLVSGETWLGDKKTGTVRMTEPPYVGMQIPMVEGGYFEITALHFEPEASS